MTENRQDIKSNDSSHINLSEITFEIQAKLKLCDTDIQQYISKLESEMLKLHKQNLSLIAKYKSLQVRLKAHDERYSDCDDCELNLIKDAEEIATKLLQDKPPE